MLSSEEYAEKDGRICPSCRIHGEISVSSGSYLDSTDTTITYMNCICGMCGETWKDKFKLVGYEQI